MLLSSRSRSETRLAGPGNNTTFLKPLSIHPCGQLGAGERSPRLSLPHAGSGRAAQDQPRAQGPEKDQTWGWGQV